MADDTGKTCIGRLLLLSLLVHGAAVIVLDALLVARLNWAFIGWLAVDCVLGPGAMLATFLFFFVDVNWRPTRRAQHYANLEAGGDGSELVETQERVLEPFFWTFIVAYNVWHTMGNMFTLVLPYNISGLYIARFCAGFGFVGFWVGLLLVVGVCGLVIEVFQGCAPLCECGLCWDACMRVCCPCAPTAAAPPQTRTPGRDSEDSGEG